MSDQPPTPKLSREDREAGIELKAGVRTFKPGGAAHQSLVESGYGMTVGEADEILAADAATVPYATRQKAKALKAAISEKPRAVSNRPGWKRSRDTVKAGADY